MSDDHLAAARRHRRWQAVAWLSFVALAVCVATGLSAFLVRLEAGYALVDDPSGGAEAYAEASGIFLRRATWSLAAGVPALVLWLVARVMCHRLRAPASSP